MATAVPSSIPTAAGDFFSGNSGAALQAEGISWGALLAAIGYAFASFGAQLLAFVIMRWRLTRIYRPRTYLVPERERVPIPPHGVIGWLKPIFATPSLEYIRKCGLDAYFFLRYLRMLLKIFFPMAVIILPILLPINRFSGGDSGETGLDVLSISNVAPEYTGHRLWAHLILAVGTIIWVCYVIFKELRGFIRVRQAYLTSPQHRIRASATTVLVTGIPNKWLTLEALEGLYDVFPGGIRNIWINRNYDELAEKVSLRDKYAKSLEEAETNLIQLCRKKHLKAVKKSGNKEDFAEARELTPIQSESNSSGNGNIREKPQTQRTPSDLQRQDVPKIPTTRTNPSQDVPSPAQTPQSMRPEAPRIPTNVLPNGQISISEDVGQHEKNNSHTLEDGVRATGLRQTGQKASDEIGLRESIDTAVGRPATGQSASKGKADQEVSSSKWAEKLMFWKSTSLLPKDYPSALKQDFDDDKDEDATWRKYIEPKDRESMRLPIFGWTWFPSLPLMGQQVDRIYYLRRELARLNFEIHDDQNNVERFPHMNSAFIQFNHQVAAHMCCQSVSHHVPQQMSPRIVEISPDDVLWDNMSIKWWERYIRFAFVVAVSIGLVVLYAIPVTFTSLLSKLNVLAAQIHWLAWMDELPNTAKGIIQGILPPALLQIILILVPIIYRLLVKLQGVPTGNARELGVQIWYFIFLFIQVFFVVSISGGLTSFLANSVNDPTGIASQLAQTLPKAANYFFSYLMIQSLSSSASALLQVGTLAVWFLIGPMMDSTPRQKWRRQTTLAFVRWGSFFPPFTNFAVIGIVYSCIAPLILFFMLIIYSLFWIVYRYNVLYVYRFRQDTGGMLFPTAVNQLFTGLYVMEICLAGFFFIARGPANNVSCIPQAIIMVVCLVLTAIYQILLNNTFKPLIHYLPITLEDEAVIRDEEFARTQAPLWEARARSSEEGDQDFEHALEAHERAEARADELAAENEKEEIARRRRTHIPGTQGNGHDSWHNSNPEGLNPSDSWHNNPGTTDSGARDSWHNSQAPGTWTESWGARAMQPVKGVLSLTTQAEKTAQDKLAAANARIDQRLARANGLQAAGASADDEEAQKTVADVLFAGVADELEDLTPEERDLLVRYAFQHSALRARRPIVWIPKDVLGVSDDEIRRGKAVSEYLEFSNVGSALDNKGRAVFERSPPDFRDVDLIAL